MRDDVALRVKICPASETRRLEDWSEMVYCLSYLSE